MGFGVAPSWIWIQFYHLLTTTYKLGALGKPLAFQRDSFLIYKDS